MAKKSMPKAKISKDKVKKIWAETFTKSSQERKIPLRGTLLISFVVNAIVIASVMLLIHSKHIPPEVPLFYGAPEGEEQLASNWNLALPALVSIIFTGINTGIAYLLKDDFLKRSLIAGAVTVTILSTITTLKIISLISSF